MDRLYNFARMTTATTGTGTITLGSAVVGFLSFSAAGVFDGDTVTYSIQDGSNSEIGRGTYTASGTTLSRDIVLRSTGTGNTGKISLSGSAQVAIAIAAEDLQPGSEWEQRTTPVDNNWQAVCYAPLFPGGLFVAVANSGTDRVMYSTDGVTWAAQVAADDATNWNAICYGNGQFVAVGGGGGSARVMRSTDPVGSGWAGASASAGLSWTGICYSRTHNTFAAVASSGTGNRVMTSTDGGATWTGRTSAADNNWTSVCYGAGLFVAVASTGTGNRVMTSPDGVTWTIRTSAADNSWNSVCYGKGIFVAVASTGTGNRVMTSPDGVTWTARAAAADSNWQSVCYYNGRFVAVGTTGTRIMVSPDGINWSSRQAPVSLSYEGVCAGNGVFVAVEGSIGTGNRAMTSGDPIEMAAV